MIFHTPYIVNGAQTRKSALINGLAKQNIFQKIQSHQFFAGKRVHQRNNHFEEMSYSQYDQLKNLVTFLFV